MTDRIITQEYLKELLDYDPATGIFTWKVRTTNSVQVGDVAGTINSLGYRVIRLHGKLYKAHRLAWLFMTGEFPSDQIDHINHVKDDNRFSNLREVTNTENHRNATMQKNNSSGVTGVSWHKATSKWIVQIHVNGKHIHGGLFGCITAATLARKALEIKHGFHENHGASV